MGLSEAAAATGVNRSTIYRAWKAGRVSATRTEIGQIEIEPAELFRVFPPVAQQQGAQEAAHPHAQTDAADDNALPDSAFAEFVRPRSPVRQRAPRLAAGQALAPPCLPQASP